MLNNRRSPLKTAALLATISASLISAALAQEEPLITDRPDFTESAATIPPGRIQVEGGSTYERTSSTRTVTGGELLVRIATGKRSELRVGVPSYLLVRDAGRTSGFDDAFLGAKFMLSTDERRPLALLLGTTLPTGARRVAERKWQPEAVLATGFDVSEGKSISFNLGYARPTDGGARFSQIFGSTSLGFDLSDKWGAFAELYVFNRTTPGGPAQKYADTGLTYLANPNLQFDARVGFGLGNHTAGPDYFYGAGVAQRF